MEKPTSVVYQEFRENLVRLINSSGLPAFIIEPVLKETLDEVIKIKQTQFEKDMIAWNESLREEENETEDSSCQVE